jgi:hypothetical protein
MKALFALGLLAGAMLALAYSRQSQPRKLPNIDWTGWEND